ncbi:hypothetical protein [Mesorhizobium dulcispinae]|uniref:hypothetical protein n=1 Tax=Mesorhizobium dulcispinae TaxID=3072316 RepID=UPI002A23C21A|nr:hypothetical protein [Mesorhizobium sp. VK23D]MDX8517955.1 hypothetical protein [Mesorhizobium sp. VK23D]
MTKTVENRLRREASRQGMRLQKSRTTGGYMLVDGQTNGAVLGAWPSAFSASIEDVEGYLGEET